jgi:alpha-L-rhamnosidase
MRTLQRVAWENPFGDGICQIVPLPSTDMLPCGDNIEEPVWSAYEPWMPVMDSADGFPVDGSGHELLVHAVHLGHLQSEPLPVSVLGGNGQGLVLEAAGKAAATRWIVDLGCITYGWLRLDLTGRVGSTLVIGLAEAVWDGIPLEVHWVESSRNAVTYRLRNGRQQFESFSAYTGRYVIIQHTGPSPVELHDLAVLSANCGTARDGSFRSSDAQLNAIYQICQRSVVVGSDDTFCNASAYEQMNCAFDARGAAIADLLTCRNMDLNQHSLRLFADDPLRDGLVAASYPGPPGRAPALAAFNWMMWVADYYWYTADRDLVVDLFPAIRQGIAAALGQRSDIGLYVGRGHGDDPEEEFQPANGAEQAAFAGALTAAMELAQVVGGSASDAIPIWQQAREKLTLGVNAVLWDGNREAYADGLDGFGIPSMISSQVTNAMMCVYGIAEPARARELVRRISMNDTSMRPYASSFGLFAVLEAFERMRALKPLFERINRHWGEMALSGDGTTWETVSMRHDGLFPTRAHCHPGSAFVAKYLLKYALGLEILKPGFAEIRIEPQMSKLTFCRGVVPTARGPIRVEWEKVNERISIKVEHPATIIRRKSR